MLMALLTLITLNTQAQSYTKKVLEKVPELEVGKVYNGKDVRAAKSMFPDGVEVDDEKAYPFAKLTGRRSVVIFYFRISGEVIYMDATSLRKKNLQPENVNRYIYNDGKIGKTVYKSTLTMNKKKVVTITEDENGKVTTKRYRIEGRKFYIYTK